jgi:cardiolipin synthase
MIFLEYVSLCYNRFSKGEPMRWDVLAGYGVVLISTLLLFAAIMHIIYQKRSSASMISWLLFIILVPPIAAPLYFIIGVRKRKQNAKDMMRFRPINIHRDYLINDSRHAIASILKQNGIPPATHSNRFQLITDDVTAFETMISCINDARNTIDIATFVFSYDETGRALLDALTRKAQEGVKVRLLLDTMGSLKAYLFQKHYFKKLQTAGGEVRFFSSPLDKLFQSYVNLRNHRKIYLFDDKVLLSGGMNLSDEYMGAVPKARWKDLLYRLEGPAVHYFRIVFESDWAYTVRRSIPRLTPQKGPFKGDAYVQAVPSGPDIPKDPLYEALLNAFYDAKTRIWIVTPYFVPDDNIMRALIIAAHKGVDVRLITPAKSDNRIADLVRSSYMRELDENGVRLELFEGEMVHAKAILIDDTGGMVGSLNLDNRSLFLNYEIVSFVYSPAFIEETERWMQTLMRHAVHHLAPPSKIREALENLMKILAPMV